MQLDDYNWFVQNYNDLQKQYGSAFLAIKDKTVLGSYESYGKAVRETKKTEDLGTFIVQECKKSGEIFQCHIASMNFS